MDDSRRVARGEVEPGVHQHVEGQLDVLLDQGLLGRDQALVRYLDEVNLDA